MPDPLLPTRVNPEVPRRYLGARDAATYLCMSVSWLRKATRRNEVPHVQIGARVLYDTHDLDEFIAELKREEAWLRLSPRRDPRRPRDTPGS